MYYFIKMTKSFVRDMGGSGHGLFQYLAALGENKNSSFDSCYLVWM
jgi:hypothetical protein